MQSNGKNNNRFVFFAILVITTLWGQWIYIKVASLYHFVIIACLIIFIGEAQYLDISLQNPVTRFLTFWLIESIVSCVWAPDQSLSFKYVYYIFMIFGLNYTLNYCFQIKKLDKYIVFFAILLFSLNLIAIWEIITGNHLVKNYLANGRGRLLRYVPASFFYNPNDFAMYIYQLFPFSLAGLCLDKSLIKSISIANIPLTFFTILKTESRTLILLLCVSLGVYAVFFMDKRHYFKIAVLAAVMIIIVTNVFPGYIDVLKSGLESVSGEEIASSADGGSLGSRFKLFGNGLMMLLHSFGLGVGAGCHRVLMKKYSMMYFNVGRLTVMHNLTMEIFVDYGLPIGFLFLAALKKCSQKLFQLFRTTQSDYLKVLSSMLLINTVSFVIIGICASSIIQLTSVWTVFCFTGIMLDGFGLFEESVARSNIYRRNINQ